MGTSRDGRTIALSDDSHVVYLMDRDTGRTRALPGRHRLGGNVLFIFSPDGRSLVSLCGGITPADQNTYEVKLWDVITGEELAGLPERLGIICAVVFSPDGQEPGHGRGHHDQPDDSCPFVDALR